MTEFPMIAEMIAENTQNAILEVLRTRFGEPPIELTQRLRQLQNLNRLHKLIKNAVVCKDLAAFEKRLIK